MARVHFETLGCRLNQAESERMARGFRLAGHEIVTDPHRAQYKVVNTCTVTANAGADSRRAARPTHEAQRVIVTGCHSEMHPEDFEQAALIVPNAEKDEMAALVKERFGMEGIALGMDVPLSRHQSIYPLAVGHTRAFVKIQDGCNLNCSFCLTTLARGISRSRKAEEILDEIRGLAEQGCLEAVLTGVHAGSYGLDLEKDLGWLVDLILRETDIPRLRLSSLEPWNFKAEWVDLWGHFGKRLCRHLHMSLQSGCDYTLKRMNRHYDGETYLEKIEAARQVPGMAITTDIIVGFPGESEAEHQESLRFVKSCQFAGAHLFTFSSRPGTAAARLPDPVDGTIKKQRYLEMKQVISTSERHFATQFIGQEVDVIWEERVEDGLRYGLTDNYIPVWGPQEKFASNRWSTMPLALQGDRLMAAAPPL